MLDSEASASAQRKGKSSEIVVPRLKTGEGGQIMLTLTPQLLADIFEEFPIVLQAYSDNVPHPVSVETLKIALVVHIESDRAER